MSAMVPTHMTAGAQPEAGLVEAPETRSIFFVRHRGVQPAKL